MGRNRALCWCRTAKGETPVNGLRTDTGPEGGGARVGPVPIKGDRANRRASPCLWRGGGPRRGRRRLWRRVRWGAGGTPAGCGGAPPLAGGPATPPPPALLRRRAGMGCVKDQARRSSRCPFGENTWCIFCNTRGSFIWGVLQISQAKQRRDGQHPPTPNLCPGGGCGSVWAEANRLPPCSGSGGGRLPRRPPPLCGRRRRGAAPSPGLPKRGGGGHGEKRRGAEPWDGMVFAKAENLLTS